MSKGTHKPALGKSLLSIALVLVLSLLPLIFTACQELSSDTSSSAPLGAGAHGTDGAAVTAAITVTTNPAAGAESSLAGKSPPPPLGEPATNTTGTTETTLLVMATGLAQPVARWTRFEETDPRLNWVGNWGYMHGGSPECSGGSERTSHHWRGATPEYACVTLRFEGTRVRLIATRHPYGLLGRVTLDGHEEFWADYLTPDRPESGYLLFHYQQIVWTSPVLASGVHEVMLERTELVNSPWPEEVWDLYGVCWISFDAVEVFGGTLIRPFD